MLSHFLKFFNIDKYYNFIKSLEPMMIECTCGCRGQCIKYGKYPRTVIYNGEKFTIYIQRIYCKHCKTTHAILPSYIIPYKHLSMEDAIYIIETYEEYPNDSYDNEANIIINEYKDWKEKLESISLTIRDGLRKIISFCARYFSMCFMQKTRKEYSKNGKKFKVIYKILQLPT